MFQLPPKVCILLLQLSHLTPRALGLLRGGGCAVGGNLSVLGCSLALRLELLPFCVGLDKRKQKGGECVVGGLMSGVVTLAVYRCTRTHAHTRT